MAVSDTEKKCPRCQVIKSSEMFNHNRARKDGLEPYCKPCAKRYITERVRSGKAKRRSMSANYLMTLGDRL